MWKFKFRSQNLEKIANFVFQNFLISVFIVFTLVILGIQTLRYLSRVSVLALKISRYIVFITNRTFYLHELFETGILIYYPAVFLWFSFHPIQLCGSLHVILCPLIPTVPPPVGGVSVFFLIRPIRRKLIETQIFDKKSCFLGCQYFITNWIRLDI